MDLSMTGRKPGSKKEKKKLFRKIKKISKLIEDHGHRYLNMLDANWEKMELSRVQVEVILRRMDNVLEQLPQAISYPACNVEARLNTKPKTSENLRIGKRCFFSC